MSTALLAGPAYWLLREEGHQRVRSQIELLLRECHVGNTGLGGMSRTKDDACQREDATGPRGWAKYSKSIGSL